MENIVVYVGKKETLRYVFTAYSVFNRYGEVSICARGRFISKAVDVAEILKKKFLSNEKTINKVEISSDTIERDIDGEKKMYRVSTIEIYIRKNGGD